MKGCLRLLCCAIVLSGFVGCGGGSNGPVEYGASGTVTFDGQPLAEGSLLLVDPAGTDRRAFAVIKDGKFSTQTTVGKKQVKITAVRADPEKMVPSGDGLSMEPGTVQYIPAQYNERTTLEIEVTDSGKNAFTFELTSK